MRSAAKLMRSLRWTCSNSINSAEGCGTANKWIPGLGGVGVDWAEARAGWVEDEVEAEVGGAWVGCIGVDWAEVVVDSVGVTGVRVGSAEGGVGGVGVRG